MISDLIYSFFLTNHKEKLKEIYELNTQTFIIEVQKQFNISYQNDISKLINNDISFCFLQEDIDQIFEEYALFFYKSSNKTFLLDRGIPISLIDKYKLGSTHIIEDEQQLDLFLFNLKSKYNTKLVDVINAYHKDIFLTNYKYYNDIHCSTIPSFDENGKCKGIVYRVEKYTPKHINFRNLHKFHISHAVSYMFNQSVINKYDTLILVEGVFDALALIKLGYENVISVSNLRLSEYHVTLLRGKNIIILYDNDMGGLTGLEYFYEHYHNLFNSVKYYQTLIKDIDTFIQTDPKQAKNYINAIIS